MLRKYYTASTYRRIWAHMVDSFIINICYAPLWIQVLSSLLKTNEISFDLRWLLVCFLFQFAYRWLFLYFMQATLGKLIFGLKVIDRFDEDKELGLMQSFLRVLCDQFSLFFGYGLAILALYRFDRTHLSDWVAETRVVQSFPRAHPAQRRWIFASLAFVYVMSTQFFGVYQILQRVKWFSTGPVVSIDFSEGLSETE